MIKYRRSFFFNVFIQILIYYDKNHQGHNDPQTIADRASQELIVSSLIKCFPQLTIRGEEVQDLILLFFRICKFYSFLYTEY